MARRSSTTEETSARGAGSEVIGPVSRITRTADRSVTADAGRARSVPVVTTPLLPGSSTRAFVPFAESERAQLQWWLDFHRETLIDKCRGLTSEQIATRPIKPSNMSLLGLIRHLARQERIWFRRILLAENVPDLYGSDDAPDADFDMAAAGLAEADLQAFRAEIAAADGAAGRWTDLDAESVREFYGRHPSLRWIYLHMIEEYARHNGNADLLRQCIDGATGV